MTEPTLKPTLHQRILSKMICHHYEQRLMNNVHRSEYIKFMVVITLGDEWQLTEPWEEFDCQHKSGKRVEIKQSAAVQAWDSKEEVVRRPNPQFDIKPPGSTDLYVYAWHGEEGDHADLRNPDQWQFFVVAERDLPNQQSISLNRLKEIRSPCAIAELRTRVMVAL